MKNHTEVFSPLKVEWIQFGEDIPYPSSFWEIIDFYLLHSLCDNQSWKGHTLCETYGWKKNPWSSDAYLKDKLLHAIWNDEDPCLYMAKTHGQFQGKLFGKDLGDDYYLNLSRQRMCYTKVSGKSGSEFMSLFHHIRNGLAHGRFGIIPLSMEDYMMVLEDGEAIEDRFEVTARIVIKGSSLLKISQIIKKGPDVELNYSDEIIDSIKRGNNIKAKIIRDTGITEAIWRRESQKLKNGETIRYENNKWVISAND